MEVLSEAAARRIALAAQGFAEPRPKGRVDRRHVRKVFDRVGVVQIDSVNVLVRSQELPLFARIGPHQRDLLPAMSQSGELFEYWGHAASLFPVAQFPLVRYQMAGARDVPPWPAIARFARERPEFLDKVLAEVDLLGPVTAAELSEPGRRKGSWWDWDDGKVALEYLFLAGLVSARRRSNFEREYDLTERMIPPEIYDRPLVPEDDARRELLAISARALGVATLRDLADYYRLKPDRCRPRLAELVEEGRLVPVNVEGWKDPAYLDAAARRPRRVDARALISPFDSLVWERARTERIFGFTYRIEIYTPEPKRQYGYYVLPFLLGEDLVARVDLKADRKARTLIVPGAFAEPGVPPEAVAAPLAEELALLAGWLGLDRVAVGERGDLAPALRRAVG